MGCDINKLKIKNQGKTEVPVKKNKELVSKKLKVYKSFRKFLRSNCRKEKIESMDTSSCDDKCSGVDKIPIKVCKECKEDFF